MSTIRRKTKVREEQRTAEAVAPPPLPPIPEVNRDCKDILLILKDGNTIFVKPAQGKDLWFYFETSRVLGTPEVIGFIRKNLRGNENE